MIFAAAALLTLGGANVAHAQADGAATMLSDATALQIAPSTAQPRLALGTGPGAELMNDLHERMKQIQATSDPALRKQRTDEFLKTLQQGMAAIGRQPATAGSAR